uniref:hypothetical protein n=1 Tax=Acetatifactor sp. TaxID=1872090 RepID=UPI004057A15C
MYTEKDNKKVNILGTDYNIKFVPEEELDERGINGYCDESTKKIVVGAFKPGEEKLEDLHIYQKKVLRHEITHAFLFESGLAECSGRVGSWATNEEMVDWIAHQHNKLHAAFEQAGAL